MRTVTEGNADLSPTERASPQGHSAATPPGRGVEMDDSMNAFRPAYHHRTQFESDIFMNSENTFQK